MGQNSLGLLEVCAIGWGREGEVDDRVYVHALHLEDDTLDRHAENFGLRERVEVVLEQRRRVEAVAMPWSSTSCTTGALGGGCLGYPTDLEGLYAVRDVVTAL